MLHILHTQSKECMHTTHNLGSTTRAEARLSKGQKKTTVQQARTDLGIRPEYWHFTIRVLFGSDGFGNLLASGSQDGTVRVWDARTGDASHVFECSDESAKIQVLPEVGAVTFFPSGDMIACGAYDGSVRLFDLHSSQPLATLHASPKPASRRRFRALRFGPISVAK